MLLLLLMLLYTRIAHVSMCVHVCLYVCMHTPTHPRYMCIWTCLFVCMWRCEVHVLTGACTFARGTHAYMHTGIYACTFVGLAYTCTHRHDTWSRARGHTGTRALAILRKWTWVCGCLHVCIHVRGHIYSYMYIYLYRQAGIQIHTDNVYTCKCPLLSI
jgi:hypothetical protein